MIAYHVDVNRRLATTRVSGKLTFSELANHLHHLIRDPKFSTDFDGLIIVGDEDSMPNPTTVKALGPLVRAWSKRRAGVRWAFVLPTANARTFAESALNEAKIMNVSARCFLSEGSALAWLDSFRTKAPVEVSVAEPRTAASPAVVATKSKRLPGA